jgi:hypothetical protein
MSPIRAESVHAGAATWFSVELGDVPAGNQPNFSWTIVLAHSAIATCENEKLAGGSRVGRGEVVWMNQGASFLWYASTDARCAGAVSVVAKNEYERCTASVRVPLPSRELWSGSPAKCQLGDYSLGPSTLPVPASLLNEYATTSSELTRLAREAGRGIIAPGRLVTLIDGLLEREHRSFSNLFPPVFGCRFDALFDPLLGPAAAFDLQATQLSAGKVVRGSAVTTITADLSNAITQIRLCNGPEAGSGRAVRRTVAALAKLGRDANRVLQRRPSPGAQLTTLAMGFRAALRGFPPVFGIPYRRLLDQIAAFDLRLSLAMQRARSRELRAAAGTLLTAVARWSISAWRRINERVTLSTGT